MLEHINILDSKKMTIIFVGVWPNESWVRIGSCVVTSQTKCNPAMNLFATSATWWCWLVFSQHCWHHHNTCRNVANISNWGSLQTTEWVWVTQLLVWCRLWSQGQNSYHCKQKFMLRRLIKSVWESTIFNGLSKFMFVLGFCYMTQQMAQWVQPLFVI